MSSDEGFYADRSGTAPAHNLQADLDSKSVSVRLVRTVEDLLTEWADDDVRSTLRAEIGEIVSAAIAVRVNDTLEGTDLRLEVQGREDVDFRSFLTEVHNQVLVSGRWTFNLVDPDYADAAEPPAYAEVAGNVTVALSGPEALDVRLDKLTVYALTPHGEPQLANIVFARAHATLGGLASVPYRLAEKIEL